MKIARTTDGGPKMEDKSGRCTLEYKDGTFASTCATSAGTMTTSYRYRIVRPHFYSATMTGSTFKTDLVGSTREYEFHVDGDRLTTEAVLTPTGAGSPAPVVRIRTEAVRMPCR